MPEQPLTTDQVRDALSPGEPGDALLITTLVALRAAGHSLDVLEVDGIGPDQAVAVIEIEGRRMRLTAQPW